MGFITLFTKVYFFFGFAYWSKKAAFSFASSFADFYLTAALKPDFGAVPPCLSSHYKYSEVPGFGANGVRNRLYYSLLFWSSIV